MRLTYDQAIGLNDGKPWSDEDVQDLLWSLDHGSSLEEASLFLSRNERSVAEKARELGRTYARHRN